MRVVRHAIALSVCVGLLLSAGSRAQAPAPERSGLQGVRAVWVLRTSLTSEGSVRRMVKAASEAGFTAILLQVRGRGEAFYESRIDPRARELPAGFDPLALTIDLAHEAGLSVHAWVNVNLVASAVNLPRSSTHVVRQHPEWLMVPRALTRDLARTNPASQGYLASLARWTRSHSDMVEGLYLSPLTREAREYSVSVIREIVGTYAVDGVHLDYVRYPGDAFDFSPAALTEFRALRLPSTAPADRDRLDAAARRDPAAWTTYLPESWSSFRRERLTELVKAIVAAVAEVGPGIPVTAAVVPDEEEARQRKGQDWSHWARTGLLDAVCPMAYATDRATFAQQVSGVRGAVGDVPVWAGIGAYRLSAAQTAAHVRVARDAGAAGVAVFSYDSVAASRDGGARYFAELRPALLAYDTQAAAR